MAMQSPDRNLTPPLPSLARLSIGEGGTGTALLADSRSFRFLDLPPELRFAIYELLLASFTLIQPPRLPPIGTVLPIPMVTILPRPLFWPNILLANHEIHAEAIHVLYSGNTFQFEFPNDSSWSHCTSKFLKSIGPSNRALIRNAEFFFSFPHFSQGGYKLKFPRYIRSFAGMQRVDLIISTSQAFAHAREKRGDKDYLERTVRLLRRHLPMGCDLRWDISGGHKALEKVLDAAYGPGEYNTVHTETKKNMVRRIKFWKSRRIVSYEGYCAGEV